jgi:hypothetical protein
MHKESVKIRKKQEPKTQGTHEPRHIKEVFAEWVKQNTQPPDLTRFINHLLRA